MNKLIWCIGVVITLANVASFVSWGSWIALFNGAAAVFLTVQLYKARPWSKETRDAG